MSRSSTSIEVGEGRYYDAWLMSNTVLSLHRYVVLRFWRVSDLARFDACSQRSS